jgi:hypothetical protein
MAIFNFSKVGCHVSMKRASPGGVEFWRRSCPKISWRLQTLKLWKFSLIGILIGGKNWRTSRLLRHDKINLCSMPPTPSRATPPSNIAQLGMGWNLASGTIDLGLELFDAIILVGTWIKGHMRKKALAAKAADIILRGKGKLGITPRAIQYAQDDTRAHWH